MEHPLLTTKLHIPHPRPNLVPRPRLVQRLNEGLHLGHRLTLISAPAGYGKTTLISEWISASQRPVAWVSLEEGDNDPVQFLRYLIAALQQIDGAFGQTVVQVLQSPQLPPPQSLVTPIINDIAATGTDLTLVLDDYQLITSPAVNQILQFLLVNQPASMHLVISTREDPALPLARLRVRGQVTEIRERDLRFTTEEAATFLNETMGLSLSPEAVTALEGRTEGWIAGLQLAALALQEDQDVARAEAFIDAFTGDDRYIADYLIAEVLQRQPDALRDFLRQTAILDRLSAPLCNALTGRNDSQTVLEQLDAANLFLIPLDRRREWYRYHRFFAEVLRTTLEPEEQQHLHKRAVRWYETHGLISQAIRHALAFASTSGDLDDAERLIGLAAEETFQSGGILTVNGWLQSLPDERVRANGELATYRGLVLVFTGELGPAKEYADAAEMCLHQACPESTQQPHRIATAPDVGKLLLLRCYIALSRRDYDNVSRLGAGALEALREDQPHWRVLALWAMAEAQERTSTITEAINALREAGRIGRAHGNQMFGPVIEATLASALNYHGQRREAVLVCEQAIARYTDDLGRSSPLAAILFSRLGTLYYEANQLALARQHHEQGITLGERLAMDALLNFCYGVSAPTLDARGETNAALELLSKAQELVTQEALSTASWLFAAEVDIRLAQGDLPFALRWAETSSLSPDDVPQFLHIESHLTYGRLLLAQGRLSDARRWLARLERFSQDRGLFRWLITIHIQQALVAERSGDRATALDRLSLALEIAAPEDSYRTCLDEDKHVIPLLGQVRHVAPSFVDQLLDDAGAPATKQELVAQSLVEPLSERELEVLRVIAAGLSNREIGQ